MGAAIVSGGRLLSVGYNKENRCRQLGYGKIHAEMDAVLRAKSNLRGAKIFVYRDKRDGYMGMAKPCPKCQKFLKEHGITRAYYTINEGQYGVMSI